MSARETAELLLLVGRRVQAEGYDGELSPAQWMALRYFARANPFSRTPSAFDRCRTKYPLASSALIACDAVPRWSLETPRMPTGFGRRDWRGRSSGAPPIGRG